MTRRSPMPLPGYTMPRVTARSGGAADLAALRRGALRPQALLERLHEVDHLGRLRRRRDADRLARELLLDGREQHLAILVAVARGLERSRERLYQPDRERLLALVAHTVFRHVQ